MILRNLRIMGDTGIKHIRVLDGRIKGIAENTNAFENIPGEKNIEFDNALAFPGLINSHDHLEFNLFPQLGNRIYNNYSEWGRDIHEQNKEVINAVLKVPERLRIQWGIYKNLLNGVTTVVNHGKRLEIKNDLIEVQQFRSLHSPCFEKRWKWKLNNPFKKGPVVMHIGEGRDADAEMEIDNVIRWNILKRKIIAVHGVAMNEIQAEYFKALVWCPASNYFLLDQTSQVDKLKSGTKILFGTDSTLTASWNFWEHLRLARKLNKISDEELFRAFTTTPPEIWGSGKTGRIEEGWMASLVIAKSRSQEDHWDAFFSLNPEDLLLVMHKGEVVSVNAGLADITGVIQENRGGFTEILAGGDRKYVKGDISSLLSSIKYYYPEVSMPVTVIGNG